MTTVTTTLVSGQNAYVGAISSRGEYSVSVNSGVQGPRGNTGVSITAANVVSGNLILTFSNSSTVDVGAVVGATGATGANGANGAAANTGNLTFSNTTITAVTNADVVIRTLQVDPSASPAINAIHSWTYSKTGTLTFPDTTTQSTAFTGSFEQITTGIPRLPEYTSATNAIHAVDISPGGTASRPGAMYFDTGSNVVRVWSSNSSTWLTFSTTTDLASYQTTAGLSANVATLIANNTSFVGTVSAANVVSNSQLSANLANYQTTAGLSANVATLSANNTSFVGTVSAANVVSNSQLQSNLANYQTTSGLSANVLTLTANNTSFVGNVSAANVVSNSQLSSNLANYQTTAGLSSNVATLTANNTSFVGSVSAANVVSNSQLSSNLANYQTTLGLSANVATLSANNASFLGTVAAASYVQNTDSRTLSGNLVFSGANTSFTGNVAFTGSKITIPFGPSNSNTDVSLVVLTLSLIT